MTPIMNVESAQPANIICISFNGGDTGMSGGGGSDGEAHAPETDWNVWGDE